MEKSHIKSSRQDFNTPTWCEEWSADTELCKNVENSQIWKILARLYSERAAYSREQHLASSF